MSATKKQTLLRAESSKGDDAELRDYSNAVAKSAEPPAK
jgi:hypothetical protein